MGEYISLQPLAEALRGGLVCSLRHAGCDYKGPLLPARLTCQSSAGVLRIHRCRALLVEASRKRSTADSSGSSTYWSTSAEARNRSCPSRGGAGAIRGLQGRESGSAAVLIR